MQPGVLLPLLTEHPQARRWVIAYSGGLDSHVLLHLCVGLRTVDSRVPELVALHVDHGVQAASTQWARHCARVCEELGVAFFSRRVQPGDGPVSEDLLRRMRYREFESFCGHDDLLLLAHHRDDQAETVLLRLLRGAGVAGLAGMPRERACGRARLCRPLLEQSRQGLFAYAQAAGLVWIDDPSNARDSYDRNFLRLRVLPLLLERFPGATEAIVRAAHNLAQADAICSERTREDLRDCTGTDRFGDACLSLSAWRKLSAARADAVLRAWIAACTASSPDARALRTLREEVIGARVDAQPERLFGTIAIRRYRDHLHAVRRQPPPDRDEFVLHPGETVFVAGVGRIGLHGSTAAGVRPGREYRVGFGAPDLRCRPVGRPARNLRELAQEHGIPPWWRIRMPLLFVDGELAAVADLCICEGFLAPAGTAALRFEWNPAAVAGQIATSPAVPEPSRSPDAASERYRG